MFRLLGAGGAGAADAPRGGWESAQAQAQGERRARAAPVRAGHARARARIALADREGVELGEHGAVVQHEEVPQPTAEHRPAHSRALLPRMRQPFAPACFRSVLRDCGVHLVGRASFLRAGRLGLNVHRLLLFGLTIRAHSRNSSFAAVGRLLGVLDLASFKFIFFTWSSSEE